MAQPTGDDLNGCALAKYEEELEKIRTEGDLALIKVQTERQNIKRAQNELYELKKQLKERKKQLAQATVSHPAPDISRSQSRSATLCDFVGSGTMT